MNFLMSFLVIFMVPTIGWSADELAGEAKILGLQQRMEKAPQTIVIRVKGEKGKAIDTSQAEVLLLGEKLPADESAQDILKNAEFQSMKSQYSETQDLNQDSSQSAWYFGLYYNPYGYWGVNTYSLFNNYLPYWYGMSYNPYYYSYWGGYNYGFYRYWW
jgi:hypothetical protein